MRLHEAAALLRQYAAPASQYALRVDFQRQTATSEYDRLYRNAWEQLAGAPLHDDHWQRMQLPAKLGGFGLQPTHLRRVAAPWAAWSSMAHEVAMECDCTVRALLEACPDLAAHLEATRQDLARAGAKVDARGPLEAALQHHRTQAQLMTDCTA